MRRAYGSSTGERVALRFHCRYGDQASVERKEWYEALELCCIRMGTGIWSNLMTDWLQKDSC